MSTYESRPGKPIATWVPATILDPFLGAGTTALVADQLQRDCIGIEINPAYAQMSEARIKADNSLFSVTQTYQDEDETANPSLI